MKAISTNIRNAVLLFLLICINSCQKSPINGDLDGQWKVIEVSPQPLKHTIDADLYYCFYMHTCMLTYYEGITFAGNFIFEDDTIHIDFPYASSDADMEILNQYGINSNPVNFTIELLNNKRMILHDGETTISLIKF